MNAAESGLTAVGLRRRFIALHALRWLPMGLMVPVLVLLPQSRGIGLGAIGSAIAAYSIVIAVLELPTGGLADAIGARRVLVAASAAHLVGVAGYFLAGSAPTLTMAAAALGVGRALASGPLEAWFVNGCRRLGAEGEVDTGLSQAGLAEGLALSVGALTAGFAPQLLPGLSSDGLITPITLPALLAVAIETVHLGGVVALLTEQVAHPRLRTALAAGAREAPTVVRLAARSVRGSRVLRILLLGFTVNAFGMVAVEMLWQPRFADLLGGAAENTRFFGLLAAGGFLASGLGAALGPRLVRVMSGRRRGGATAQALQGLAVIAMALTPGLVLPAGAYLVHFLALGAYGPIVMAMVHAAADDDQRTTVVSGTSLAGQAGVAVSQVTLTNLAATAGVPLAWILAGSVLMLGAPLYLRLRRDEVSLASADEPGPGRRATVDAGADGRQPTAPSDAAAAAGDR